MAGGNIDAVEFEGDTLDVCLSHPTPTSQYHYHFWGSCLVKDYGYWNDSEAPPLCREFNDCVNNTGTFTKGAAESGQNSFYSASNWDKPIGLARDGHIILGPYKSDGSSWTCADHDICNGAFVGSNADVYAYVGTSEFPYVLGCWGLNLKYI